MSQQPPTPLRKKSTKIAPVTDLVFEISISQNTWNHSNVVHYLTTNIFKEILSRPSYL